MTDPKMDHVAEAEGYLRDLDSLDPPEAYVAVVAAQAHATLAQGLAAQQMVDLQRLLLESMVPAGKTAPSDDGASAAKINHAAGFGQAKHAVYDELRKLHADAITAERKGGLQRAMEFVEGLQP